MADCASVAVALKVNHAGTGESLPRPSFRLQQIMRKETQKRRRRRRRRPSASKRLQCSSPSEISYRLRVLMEKHKLGPVAARQQSPAALCEHHTVTASVRKAVSPATIDQDEESLHVGRPRVATAESVEKMHLQIACSPPAVPSSVLHSLPVNEEQAGGHRQECTTLDRNIEGGSTCIDLAVVDSAEDNAAVQTRTRRRLAPLGWGCQQEQAVNPRVIFVDLPPPLSPTRDRRLRPIGWGNSAHMDTNWPNTDDIGRLRRRLLQLGITQEDGAEGRSTTPLHLVAQVAPVLPALPAGASVEECSICLLPFDDEQVSPLVKCAHFFHVRCIRTWLELYSQRCPVCNTLVIDSSLSAAVGPVTAAAAEVNENTAATEAAPPGARAAAAAAAEGGA
jgi:hypothetical protein